MSVNAALIKIFIVIITILFSIVKKVVGIICPTVHLLINFLIIITFYNTFLVLVIIVNLLFFITVIIISAFFLFILTQFIKLLLNINQFCFFVNKVRFSLRFNRSFPSSSWSEFFRKSVPG